MRLKAHILTIGILSMALLAGACGGASDGPVKPGGDAGSGGQTIQGAGATFPYPLYSKWISEYNKKNPSLKIDYQSIGSGGGIKQITERTVDFGATDAPMNDEQLKQAQKEILHIPTVLGAVVVTYNLAEVSAPLQLDGPTVAAIFMGDIKKWNDPKIAATNAGVALPSKDIAVVHRSDGSGTTAIFVDYMAKVSPEWKDKVGVGTSVNWPTGIGGKGNEGVSGSVKQTPGSIGYVELIYAKQNNLAVASIKNSAGKFVVPSLESVTAAAAGVAARIPDDLRVSVTNADGEASYPISGFTYLLVYKDMESEAKAKALVDFIWWALSEGEKMAGDLGYSALPAEVLTKAQAKVRLINVGGKTFVP